MASTVLVADADAGRARGLEQALRARGFATLYAPQGAAALETALAERPAVIVAPAELPLIDPAKLAEILRANPRTRTVRFVVLGGGGGDTVPSSWDEVICDPGDADAVAREVERVLARRAQVEEMDRRVEGGQEVQGRLSQIPLADLLQLFQLNRKTGTVELHCRRGGGRTERGLITLRDGDVIQAVVGNVEGEKAFFRLLGWREGAFAFTPHPVEGPARILTPTRSLLMEGLRQQDELDHLVTTLPPLDAEVSLRVRRSSLPSAVHPLTQEVLLLLEIYGRVQDVVDHCSFPDYQVLRTLKTLRERGLVEIRAASHRGVGEGLAAPASPARIRRLREWLEERAGRGAVGDAKVLLAAADAAAVEQVLQALHPLPGLRRLRAPGGAGAGIGTLARLELDRDVGLELIRVPVDELHAPVWPLAARGALAAVLVLPEPTPEARATLDAAAQGFAAAGLSRRVYLVTGVKEEPAGDDLRELLRLEAEARAVVLAEDTRGDRLEAARRILTQVLP